MASVLRLFLDGDGSLKPHVGEGLVHCGHEVFVSCLEGGTTSGRPTFMVALKLPDGRLAVGEGTIAQFITAAAGMNARWPNGEPAPPPESERH